MKRKECFGIKEHLKDLKSCRYCPYKFGCKIVSRRRKSEIKGGKQYG